MAVTYNAVLGHLWRLCCTRREDARLEKLKAGMSKCLSSLSAANRALLQTWLDQSYNFRDEINARITAEEDAGCQKFYVLDADVNLPGGVRSLHSLARAPHPGVLKSCSASSQACLFVWLWMRALPCPLTRMNKLYIPVSFDDEKLFAHIPHPNLLRHYSRKNRRPCLLCCAR